MTTDDTQQNNEHASYSLHSLSEGVPRPNRKRKGRGNASGNGRTAGKGEKGQKARSGVSIPAWFEGGGLPLYRKIPKFGFRSRQQISGENRYLTVSLAVLDSFEDGAVVDVDSLAAKGYKAGAKQKAGIKVLGDGTLSKKLTVKVEAATKSAQAEIEKAGGTVEIVKKEAAQAPTE